MHSMSTRFGEGGGSSDDCLAYIGSFGIDGGCVTFGRGRKRLARFEPIPTDCTARKSDVGRRRSEGYW